MNRRFIREVEIEKQERNKLNQLVFVASANFVEEAPVIEYPSLFGTPSEPRFLFPKLRKIFKKRTSENDLLEFCLKAFIRNRTLRTMYFKVIGFPYFAVFILPIILQGLFQTILPIWIRLLFYPVMLYALYKLTEILYWKLVHHSFFEVVPMDKCIKYSPQKRFQIWLILPIAILTAFIWLYLDFPYNILPLGFNAFIL